MENQPPEGSSGCRWDSHNWVNGIHCRIKDIFEQTFWELEGSCAMTSSGQWEWS